jgi:predicted adenylyl cyclase CyaB
MPGTDPITIRRGTRMRNIEIKARATHFEDQMARAATLSDRGPELLLQEDTFFTCRSGRLKLRRFSGGRAELIAYDRPDGTEPRASRYVRTPVADPEAITEILAQVLGIRSVVRKKRTLFLLGQTRLHFDEVEGLGRFIEIEVVLEDGGQASEGVREARRLMEIIEIDEADLIECAYVDLLEGADVPITAAR